MKRGREFSSVTSGQLYSAVTPRSISLISSPTPSTPSPRTNEAISQGMSACPSSCAYHFDLDYTRQEDVRTVVETMMTARRTHATECMRILKSSRVKRQLLKPHPDTTEEQWKELCDLFTSEAFMKRSEQNKKNRSKLTVNHAAGSRSFQRTRACMERMDAFQRQCDLEGKTYTEIEVYSEILGKKSGYVRD
ncbi:hypothetical protein CJ030_MR1G015677 [Morella rubra]|uniref:Uncharacterized protein n=1 Tax=Morella rubra TaxID=262757 RepID=A0A6A1WKX2_9ROSI|nr:hypothetical protein CJ030_MR1G015677 [Morella rubra]